jgi:glucosamine-6-phosphate deaminase
VRIIVCESVEEVAERAAIESIEYLGEALAPRGSNEDAGGSDEETGCVLGLATGSTPLGLYREWIERYRSGEISFRNVTSFNLDEYCGVPPSDPQSYHAFMQENLFRHIDIDLSRTHIPITDCEDIHQSAERYEAMIEEAGGIDLQILGIGSDGHIGFNEPGSSFSSPTRIKTLAQRTRQDNARFFQSIDQVPRMALTMGLGTIMSSRSILLLATGQGKARAIRETVEGPITAMVPASILQFHPYATVIVDRAAASELSQIDYYIESERNRQT